ncbi:hypothetical protein J007_04128 [Cryptococcus neoformans]|nr:hypothetical protein J007_04128 [Cryptococcus neoformans var. grubii]OXC60289.1 hypothetical protein C358_04242 [Cryptococcus neoformans var. grubii MW-RSA852]
MADQVMEEYMQPRELGEDELWMAWGKFGKLPADILYDLDDYSTPTHYRSMRVTYDLMSPDASADLHSLRLARALIWETAEKLMTPFDDQGMSFRKTYQNAKLGNLRKPLAKRLDELDNLKEKANKKYRDGNFQEELKGYTTAWKEVLPHHVEALPD